MAVFRVLVPSPGASSSATVLLPPEPTSVPTRCAGTVTGGKGHSAHSTCTPSHWTQHCQPYGAPGRFFKSQEPDRGLPSECLFSTGARPRCGDGGPVVCHTDATLTACLLRAYRQRQHQGSGTVFTYERRLRAALSFQGLWLKFHG